MNYTNNIKKLRMQSGLSIRQLAECSGVSRSSLSAIENNKQDFKVSTLVNLAKFFDCDLSDMINF